MNNLLTQIYRHLDDDCLYLMPTDQLSKKLGIAVYAYLDMKTGKPIKDRFKELIWKPFTDLRSGIFLEKVVFTPEGRSIEKLSLKEQRQRNSKKFGVRRNSIGYRIFFSYAYLDNQPSPFYKDRPITLPKPDNFYSDSFTYDSNFCDDVAKLDSYYNRGNENQWVKGSGTYFWYGYTLSNFEFKNCPTGANNFKFRKFFYLSEE